jgi:hypothetical protein
MSATNDLPSTAAPPPPLPPPSPPPFSSSPPSVPAPADPPSAVVQVAPPPLPDLSGSFSFDDPYDAQVVADTDAPRRGFFGWCRENEDERFEHVLTTTHLSRMQKNSIRRRFLEILREFRFRCRMYSLLYHVGHFTITVGSLVVPALLSVQYAGAGVTFVDPNSFQAQVYWTTWILSLLVTMFNGVLVLFKVDMKYYFLHTTVERLRSEGWQYLQLTGRYAGTPPSSPPTHRNQFKYFCHYIEKIKLKQVEEEYYKYEDSQKNATPAGAAAAGSASAAGAPAPSTAATTTALPANFYPPSLQNNLATLAEQAPPSVQDAIRGLVRTQPFPRNETVASPSRAANAINSTNPLPMQPPMYQAPARRQSIL